MNEKAKPRVKSRREKIVEIFVLLLLLCIAWAIVIPPNGGRARQNARRISCGSNLGEIMLSVKQYVQDYDGKYPLVASGAEANSGKQEDFSAFGWADTIQPYVRSRQIFQCPSEENAVADDALQPQFTDYWFNAHIARKRDVEIEEVAQTIALGEGNDGTDPTNARYHLLEIPKRWRSDEKSPLYRHLETANFAFADGHVKALKGSSWKNGLDSDNMTKPTLRLKPLAKPKN